MAIRALAWASLCLVACSNRAASDPGPADAAPDSAVPIPDAGEVSVEVGVPSGEDSLGFAALEAGGELRLQSFGQGGTHIYLAVRCVGFGNRAFVAITLTNLETMARVVSPAPVRPQLLLCRDEATCDLVPILAMTSGLTEAGAERDGVRVSVTAEVRNTAGLEAVGTQEGVLSTRDL